MPTVCLFGTQGLGASLVLQAVRFGLVLSPAPPHSSLKDHGFVTVTVEVSIQSSCCSVVQNFEVFYCGAGNAMQLVCDTKRAVNLTFVRDAKAHGSHG